MRKKQKLLPSISDVLLVVILIKVASVFGELIIIFVGKLRSDTNWTLCQFSQVMQHATMDRAECRTNVCQINSYRDSMTMSYAIQRHRSVYWKNVKIYVCVIAHRPITSYVPAPVSIFNRAVGSPRTAAVPNTKSLRAIWRVSNPHRKVLVFWCWCQIVYISPKFVWRVSIEQITVLYYVTASVTAPGSTVGFSIEPIQYIAFVVLASRPERECPNRRYVFERHPRKKLKLPVSDIKEVGSVQVQAMGCFD